MSSAFTPFSGWAPAALLRLILYPGGVWVLLTLFVLYFARGGRAGTLRLYLGELSRSPAPAAIAWVGIALLPLPAAPVLTFPLQAFSLVVLFIASLLTQVYTEGGGALPRPLHIAATLLLAALSLMLPLSRQPGVFQPRNWPAVLAGLVCLWALSTSDTTTGDLSGDLRLLGWLGLLLAPLLEPVWSHNRGTDAFAWTASAYLVVVVAVGLSRRWQPPASDNRVALICWGLAALALVAVLV